MDYETILTMKRKGKVITVFLKQGEALALENIVDVEVIQIPQQKELKWNDPKKEPLQGGGYIDPPTKGNMNNWISVKDKMPKKGEWIIYSTGSPLFTYVGRYFNESEPMPSLPAWLNWKQVKYWIPLPESPKEQDGLDKHER